MIARSLLFTAATVFVGALGISSGFEGAADPSCPARISAAQAHLSELTTTPGISQTEVEVAWINLIETNYACEVIPRGRFCREKNGRLRTIARIAARSFEQGSGSQAEVDRTRKALAAHRAACGFDGGGDPDPLP